MAIPAVGALTKIPENLNLLSPLGFHLTVKKLPHTNFFLQRVNIPSLSILDTQHPTPFVKIPYSGEHIEYGDLHIEFKVDEQMKNYDELNRWLRGLGFPEDFAQYKELNDADQRIGDGIVSDISLIILTNLKNPNIELVFRDAFPISLSELRFETTDADVNFISCECAFKFQQFILNILPKP